MLMHTYIGSGPINRRGNQDLSMNNYEFPFLYIRNRCLGTGEASKKAHFRGFSKRSVPASVPRYPAQETALFIRCSPPKPSGVSPLRSGSGPPAQRRTWTHHIEPT